MRFTGTEPQPGVAGDLPTPPSHDVVPRPGLHLVDLALEDTLRPRPRVTLRLDGEDARTQVAPAHRGDHQLVAGVMVVAPQQSLDHTHGRDALVVQLIFASGARR